MAQTIDSLYLNVKRRFSYDKCARCNKFILKSKQGISCNNRYDILIIVCNSVFIYIKIRVKELNTEQKVGCIDKNKNKSLGCKKQKNT